MLAICLQGSVCVQDNGEASTRKGDRQPIHVSPSSDTQDVMHIGPVPLFLQMPRTNHISCDAVTQVLWVNDNSLSRITNLDYNPTIKSLYAHNNRIGTLKV